VRCADHFEFRHNALIPTKDFYLEYPDAARLFINERSTNNTMIRGSFWKELPNAMAEVGIEWRDTAMTGDSMR